MYKIPVSLNLTRITGTLHEDRHTLMIICRSVLLKMRNVSDKSCRENQNTHFMFNNVFFNIVPCTRYMEKHCTAGQGTVDNMAQAQCMLNS